MGIIAANQPAPEEEISNDTFFPDVSPADCRDVLRLDDNITPGRLRAALIQAIIHVNGNLSTWVDTQITAGVNHIESVNSPLIDGERIHTQQYRTAVYYHAKANLLDQYRDYDTSNTGSERAEDKEQTADEYRRQAILAMRNITGTPHTTVELI